jgi:hypothetical protein
MIKKIKSGSGMKIPDHTYFRELRNNYLDKKCLNSLLRIRTRDPESFDPGSGIRDQVWKNSDLGSGINIPYLQHCIVDVAAVLVQTSSIESEGGRMKNSVVPYRTVHTVMNSQVSMVPVLGLIVASTIVID